MIVRWLVLVALATSLNAAARDTWRWVDESGTTHYGDSVPERYQLKAMKLGPRGAPPTEAQQREAHARLARDKAAAEAGARTNTVPPVTRRTAESRPDAATLGLTACEAAKKKFQDSADCFGQFRLVGGGVKAEAFQHCEQVPRPDCE